MAPSDEGIVDQSGKLAVVTGASSGLGWQTARGLAKAGARVVLACRNRQRGKRAIERILRETPHALIELMTLDLASLDSVSAFAHAYHSRFDRLDVLVNCAGVMFPPRTRTHDGFELQFGVNHLGHFALTARLFQALRATPSFRVVTVTSAFHWWGGFDLDDVRAEHGYARVASYALSKVCNLLFAFELARRLARAGSSGLSLAAHPGLSRSNLAEHSPLVRVATRVFGQSPENGARPMLHAATSDAVRSGDFYGPQLCAWGRPDHAIASPTTRRVEFAEALWAASEAMAGVPFEIEANATA